MTLEQLKKALDNEFQPPFLKEGLVKTMFVKGAKPKTLNIKIGARDIDITESGKVTGAGTCL